MPQFNYRGRDREGRLREGERSAENIDTLNAQLIQEGISPIKISVISTQRTIANKFTNWIQGRKLQTKELTIFARQMQLLYDAGVPIVVSLKQLANNTRSKLLRDALNGIIENLEKGESLASSMQKYSDIFSPLIINIVQIGETTGRLGEAFTHIHDYLAFESSTIKQLRSAFRYPLFVIIAVIAAIIILNIFVIPSFASFYVNLHVPLPWQTRLLIGMSNLFVYYGWYLLAVTIFFGYLIHLYLQSESGSLRFHHLQLRLPIIGPLLKRILLIRFSQAMAIILNSGISITQGLSLIKTTMLNRYIYNQIAKAQEDVERGTPFTASISKIDLFSSLEIQILAVGEKNGELSPALNYIADFHNQEIEYDLKTLNDFIGPVLIGIISILVLIIALGVYLPIWNMINLTKG